MKVKDILRDAIIFTNHAQLLALSNFNDESITEPTADQQADIDLYVRCFNFIYKEIASCYFPFLEKEEIAFSNNQFALSSLTKNAIHIKKVVSGSGRNLKFYLYPEYIFCETESAEIIYSFLPSDLGLTDEVNLFSGQVIPQVLSYGVAREFSLINGDYADADVWESRFKGGIVNSMCGKHIPKISKRRFR